MQDKLKIKVKKATAIFLCLGLFFQQTAFAQVAGSELSLSGYFNRPQNYVVADKFRPSHLRYFSYDAFRDQFQVLLDKGDARQIEGEALKENTRQLLDYFLIGVALPNDVFWVNLRPDTPDQIIDPVLAQTDIGKIFLEADLQLKKDTARFTSPQTPEGRAYWDKLYKKAGELFGSENVTIPTLTRPWIVPGEIIIRETEDSAYIYKATLKVMLESDYLKSSNNPLSSSEYNFRDPRLKALNEYSAEIIREQIIPKLTKDINISQRYAPLRQVFYSLILSRWFKSRFTGKNGSYASLINTGDLSGLTSKEQWSKNFYFKEYQKSFKDGEYNIQEPIYSPYGQTMRSYFSGGANFSTIDFARTGSSPIELGAFLSRQRPNLAPLLARGFFAAFVSIAGTGLLAEPPQPALVSQAPTQIAAEVPFRNLNITNEPERNLTRFAFSGGVALTSGGNDAFWINIKGTTAQGQPFDVHIRTDWPFLTLRNNGLQTSRNPQAKPEILPTGEYTITIAHVTYGKDDAQQVVLQSNPRAYTVASRVLLPGETYLTTGSYDLLPALGGIKGGGVSIGGSGRPKAVSPFLEKTPTDKKGPGSSSPASSPSLDELMHWSTGGRILPRSERYGIIVALHIRAPENLQVVSGSAAMFHTPQTVKLDNGQPPLMWKFIPDTRRGFTKNEIWRGPELLAEPDVSIMIEDKVAATAASPMETLTPEEMAERLQYVDMGVIVDYKVPGVKTSVIGNWSPDLDRNRKGLNMLQPNSEKEALVAARRIAKPYLLTPEEEADYQVLKDMGLIRRSMNLGIDGKLYFAALLNWNPDFQPDSPPDIRNYTSRKDALSEIRGLLSHFRLEEIRTHVLERPGLLNAYLRALGTVQGSRNSFEAQDIIPTINRLLSKDQETKLSDVTRGIGTPAQGLRGVVEDLLYINANIGTIQAGMNRASIVSGGMRTINGMINAEGIIVELKEVLDTAETSRRQLYGFR